MVIIVTVSTEGANNIRALTSNLSTVKLHADELNYITSDHH